MAKIYAPPEGMPLPKLDWNHPEKYNAAERKWTEKLRAWCKANSKHKLAGEIVRVSVADGYACYMVVKPTVLIHMPLGDAYQFPWAHRWTAKDVVGLIEAERAMNRLFAKQRNH